MERQLVLYFKKNHIEGSRAKQMLLCKSFLVQCLVTSSYLSCVSLSTGTFNGGV